VLAAAVGREQMQNDRVTVYFSSGVYDAQTASVSTAVFASGLVLVGALTVSGPIGRFGMVHVRKIAAQLVVAARELSTVLGAPSTALSGAPRIIRL
jgi:DNA-binding IclR family transcriptional regulator